MGRAGGPSGGASGEVMGREGGPSGGASGEVTGRLVEGLPGGEGGSSGGEGRKGEKGGLSSNCGNGDDTFACGGGIVFGLDPSRPGGFLLLFFELGLSGDPWPLRALTDPTGQHVRLLLKIAYWA